MENKPHISKSQLGAFNRCGVQYYRRYICGEKIPPGWALHVGSATHGAAEKNYRQKIESHEDLPVNDIKDIAAESFNASLNTSGVMLTPDEESVGIKKLKGIHLDESVELAGLYSEKVAPKVQPVEVELECEVNLPGSHDLLGYLDCVDDHQNIRELKTSNKSWGQNKVNTNLEVSFYWLLFMSTKGKEPAEFAYDILVKKKVNEEQELKTRRTKDDLNILIARINVFLKALKTGVFLPAEPDSWICSIRFCGYASTCPYCMDKTGG